MTGVYSWLLSLATTVEVKIPRQTPVPGYPSSLRFLNSLPEPLAKVLVPRGIIEYNHYGRCAGGTVMNQGEKSEKSQSKILEAALQLFSKQGYRGTSIRDIADLAGVSTGNVYHHFPDKETIFRTLLDQYWTAIDSPDFPFNKALASGAFPDDLEALGRAAEESVRIYKRHITLIYVDVVEFDGDHIRKFYSDMSGRFASFMAKRYGTNGLGPKLRPGISQLSAVMLVSRILLHYYATEILFGVQNQFGKPSSEAIRDVADILRHGLLKSIEPITPDSTETPLSAEEVHPAAQ